MLENTFKDMEYIRVMDYLLDIPDDPYEIEIDTISKNCYIPSDKVREIMLSFQELGIVKYTETIGWKLVEDSKIFHLLNQIDFEISTIFARKIADKLKEED